MPDIVEGVAVMMGFGWGMGPAGWLFMGLFWLVVVGLLVWAAAALLPGYRGRTPERRAGHAGPTPEEVLDLRFARGEVDAEQYRQARRELAEARQGRG